MLERIPKSVFKYCSIVGAHLLLVNYSFIWIAGNLTAYMDSYFMFACKSGCADVSTQWIFSLYIACTCFGIFAKDPLQRRIGTRACGIISSVLGSAAIFGMAWSMKRSIMGTAILVGCVLSPCVGLTLGVSFYYIYKLAPDQASVLTATATSFPTILAIVENQIITQYVNPDNLEPDAVLGPRTYFSQPELLSRVPRVIILIGVITFTLQIVGNLLLLSSLHTEPSSREKDSCREPLIQSFELKQTCGDFLEPQNDNSPIFNPCDEFHLQTTPLIDKNCDGATPYENIACLTDMQSAACVAVNESQDKNDGHADFKTRTQHDNYSWEDHRNCVYDKDERLETESDKNRLLRDHHYYGSNNTTVDAGEEGSSTICSRPANSDSKLVEVTRKNQEPRSWKPREVVKTWTFWATWIFAFTLSYALVIKNNYYKQFGLIYIPDDKFLTLVGSVLPLASTICRILFGFSLDRDIITVQDGLVLGLASNTLLCAFWFFTAQLHRTLYMLNIIGLASAHSAIYVVLPTAARRLWGEEHFTTNYALLFSCTAVIGISTALVVQPILDAFGWFWLFISVAGLSLIGLIATATANFKVD